MSTETEILERQVTGVKSWKPYEIILFRIALPFFLIMCLPLTGHWYSHFFHVDWTNLHVRDLYDIVLIRNDFVPATDGYWGLGSYNSWWVSLAAAIIIGTVWSLLDRNTKEYDTLYKWLRVIVRYRVAIGIIGFSFEKLFPTQMPYPSLSNLATDFGDFNGHKIFWGSIGIVPWFQVFSGAVELIPGAMLLFRRTATWGAILSCAVMLTIVFINLGYNYHPGGIHVYASYFVLLTLFLLVNEIPVVYKLIVKEEFTLPAIAYPILDKPWLKYTSTGVKIFLGIYFLTFGYLFYLNFRYDPYKQPSTKGVKELYGYYDVVDFKVNNVSISYSPLDSVRWQDVTFERWSTLTYRVNKKLIMSTAGGKSSSNTGHSSVDLEKAYEIMGVAGGRRAFHYYYDTINQVIYLQEKKRSVKKKDPYPNNWIDEQAWKNIGDDNHKIHPRAWSTRRDRDFALLDKGLIRDKMVLKYTTVDGSKVILEGTDENKNSIYVVLVRKERDHTLSESNIKAGYYPY